MIIDLIKIIIYQYQYINEIIKLHVPHKVYISCGGAL